MIFGLSSSKTKLKQKRIQTLIMCQGERIQTLIMCQGECIQTLDYGPRRMYSNSSL
jgi:hypothetical protein